ncbi:MAG TPA: CvpA family protein [Chloroflexia bacterium]
MMLVLDGVLVAVLVVFALVGARRGPWPEVVALGGLLLGALLADEWGEAWGNDLGSALGFLGPVGARMIVRSVLFLVPLIAVGYGGALLLPRLGKPSVRARLIAALLALFNGAAILAVLLRNWDYSQGATGSPLRNDAVTRFFLEWAGWWPLLLALGGIVAVAVSVLRRPRRVTPPAPVTLPAPLGASKEGPAPAIPAPAGSTIPATSGAPRPASKEAPAPASLPVRPAISSTPPATPAGDGNGVPRREPAASDERRCRTCGKVLAPGAAFCPNCGTPV